MLYRSKTSDIRCINDGYIIALNLKNRYEVRHLGFLGWVGGLGVGLIGLIEGSLNRGGVEIFELEGLGHGYVGHGVAAWHGKR